ncbi:MAG: glycosyltransferase [Bacteroidetes bacterium]|nr:glycosyltransferase [Bacteroidota bacterium]
MNNCFISIVGVIDHREDLFRLPVYLNNLFGVLHEHFSDFEIILVNNTNGLRLDDKIEALESSLKQNIFVLNLSSPVNKNHAVVAGLDRSNGDYTVIFEFDFYQKPAIIQALFDESSKGNDIVYLRAKSRESNLRFRLFYKLFYWILRNYSTLQVDDRAHDTRIISRRALNSLLRLRENLRYMKAIYSIVGFRTTSLEVDEPLQHDGSGFGEKFSTSLVAITSFTTFLRALLLWIFVGSLGFLIFIIGNALKVKMTNVDFFGDYHDAVPGWTFLVVLTSIFFAITCLILYIMSIYLSNIYEEIKHRPMYIIESVKRF